MIDKGAKTLRQAGTTWSSYVACALLVVCAFASAACKSAPRNMAAVHSYYRYDFTTAREALRGDAVLRNNEEVVLNNTRLGMAALADGDLVEAEQALGKSFEYLSTAGLNKDRTIGAVFVHEGVRIWKGEPFEQALTYYQVAALYALMGDWENTRAAAANSLFRLTDFGGGQSARQLARRIAEDSNNPRPDYTAVDTNFALGFLMQAIGGSLSGAPGSEDQLEAAAAINPALAPIVQQLRQRDYDTLLIVDYGKGPTKISYGEDSSLVKFLPQDRAVGPLEVSAAGQQLIRAPAACDVNAMAIDHRWNNLENVRKAKSAIGSGLLVGGMGATAYGAHRGDEAVALAGLAAMGVGLLSKSGAKADTRYCEFMPAAVYLVPLQLHQVTDLRISVAGDPKSLVILDDVQPGETTKPRAIYLRLLGPGSPAPPYLTQRKSHYSNDETGVFDGPDGFPWVLGGRDLSTPTRQALEAYQANGYLLDMTLSDLQALYAAEDLHIGSGMENRPDMRRNPSFRHVLEGGTAVFTPQADTVGYKRLMCSPREPYRPKSELVRNAAAAIRVQHVARTSSNDQEKPQ